MNLGKHLRNVYFGGNWSLSCIKDTLVDTKWPVVNNQVYDFNSIATISYHMTYYVSVLLKLLKGGALEGKDELSFALPPIDSQEDWEFIQNKFWTEAEETISLLETLPENRLLETFKDEKYGNYFRNIVGIIEHLHYHLGQIVLIKKIIEKNTKAI